MWEHRDNHTHAQVFKCPLSWRSLKNRISNTLAGCGEVQHDLWWGGWAEWSWTSHESNRVEKRQWGYNECGHGWTTMTTQLSVFISICSMVFVWWDKKERKKERNAKCRLFVYFHIFCVRGRNSTSLKHFLDYLTNYWNCKFFSLLLVKGYFGVYRLPLNCKTAFCGGWTSATLIINSQWQFIWLPRLEKTLQNIVFSGIIKQNQFAFRVIVRGACVRAQRKITN